MAKRYEIVGLAQGRIERGWGGRWILRLSLLRVETTLRNKIQGFKILGDKKQGVMVKEILDLLT